MTNPATPHLVAVPGHQAFTCRYPGRSLTLTSEVEIFPAFLPPNMPQGKKYKALYDTGATHSAVSPQVVADLQLAEIGATNVGVGGGNLTTPAIWSMFASLTRSCFL